jgi:SNF2 family DNA or RNA helicase
MKKEKTINDNTNKTNKTNKKNAINVINEMNEMNEMNEINEINEINETYCQQTQSLNILINYKEIKEIISEILLDNNLYYAYKEIQHIELEIANNLLAEILENSPKTDISITNFDNIKTELFPYQINNVNWMLNIENRNYTEEYNEIKEKLILRGGGLFDEVGMGKTLQIITLINTNKSNYTSRIKNNKLYTKSTLILVPNHLCGQWEREFEKHLKKPLKIIKMLTKRHYNKYSSFDIINSDIVIMNLNFFINCKINQHEGFDPLYNFINLFEKDVNVFNLFWHRVVIDEYHELEDSLLFKKIKFLESDYKWIMSGTPFKEHSIVNFTDLQTTSLSKIIDYLTNKTNIINNVDITENNTYQYIKNHFSRNTHKENMLVLKLPTIKEENIWLNFTNTERMIYNAYLADPNNTAYDIFLRQICCHPMLSEKIRENMTNKLESLSDMQNHIKKMYFTDYDKAEEHYNECLARIERITNEINKLKEEDKTHLIQYQNLVEDLEIATYKLEELKKIKDGREKTLIYYKTFLNLLSDINNITKENCTICLSEIKEHDLGITNCGHIYCYSCINTIIKSDHNNKCPNCSKKINLQDIFLIGKNTSKEVDTLGTKLAYIIKYIKSTPNKYRIIFSQWDYLLKEVGKVLEQNNLKTLYCQGNVYQKDKVLKLFNNKDIENNEFKIIMLSSETSVSGSNLNNAEEVIFLDPIYGSKQFRLNTENQAIGRVRRLGNKFKEIKVLRLLIKDSIEEEIFNNNNNIKN